MRDMQFVKSAGSLDRSVEPIIRLLDNANYYTSNYSARLYVR